MRPGECDNNPPPMKRERKIVARSPDEERSWQAGVILLVGLTATLLLLSGWIWWLTARDPGIPFLSRIGPAAWIVYPPVPDAKARNAIELSTVFRRLWILDRAPARASLQVRAFEQCQVAVNGARVGIAPRTGDNWKKPTVYDASGLLHAGSNEISVVVANHTGPPALWLSLKTDEGTLNSDEAWRASIPGAVWQPARLASAPMVIRTGNPLAGGERCADAFLDHLPTLFLFAVLSIAILSVARHPRVRGNELPTPSKTGLSQRQAVLLVLLAAGGWIVLFAHNLTLWTVRSGFDVNAHLEYIDYLRQQHALPLATAGWETHQPPLYYLICAGVLSLLRLPAVSGGGLAALRVLGLVFGLIQIGLVFACVRLIFPDNARRQTIGLILAASLPVNLYLYHYVTNEILASMLVAASVYCCLRIFNSARYGVGQHVALGFCLGGALLTKITALAVAPVILATLAGRLMMRKETSVWVWLRTVGVVCLVALLVSGWHYLRVWIHFHNLLIGNYDSASGFAWWQDPGFATRAYYLRFGKALVDPLFSGFHGFADGLYSTFWGDGLCGGLEGPGARPPWNYGLMVAG